MVVPLLAGRRSSWLGLPAVLRDRALGLLAEVGLAGRENQPAGELPYGLQRRLEIARALAVEPSVLLLDEPLAGLARPPIRRPAPLTWGSPPMPTTSLLGTEGAAPDLLEIEDVAAGYGRIEVLHGVFAPWCCVG
ncbi:ATP-binding cassette domain-containing protein [Nonomuraea sp. 3N208]|uniref:ATP-binding cassette domain-containing protein n=1 Tax=Nonomuraea sp. 3N208 TaxID=3457421 RepID=UPI003FCF0BE2